ATRLDPHNSDAWCFAGEEALRLGNRTGAEQALRQAISHNARDWRSQLDLGEILIEPGQAGAAVSCFEAATSIAPEEAMPSRLLGKQLLSQAVTPAQIQVARRYLEQSAQIQANNAEVNHQIGISEMRLSHWQAARDYLERAVRFAPADATIVSDLISV